MEESPQLLWTIDFLKKLLYNKPKYTGSIHLNLFKGSVANVNLLESFKPEIKQWKENNVKNYNGT